MGEKHVIGFICKVLCDAGECSGTYMEFDNDCRDVSHFLRVEGEMVEKSDTILWNISHI